MGFDGFFWMRQAQAQKSQNDENSSRLAQCFANYTTTGWGEFKDPTRINFGVTFIEEPSVGHGYSMNGDDLVATRFPRAWGFVAKWDQDNRGYYTGCWVATVVETQSFSIPTVVSTDPGYSIDHTFVFTGIAIKDFPAHLLDAA